MKKTTFACLLLSAIFVIHSCQKESQDPPVSILGFTPAIGLEGATITISGHNFSTDIASNIVKFNGTVASVTSCTSTAIKVTVPSGASSGPITVTKGSRTATSESSFTLVMPDGISNFTPSSGTVGTQVTITGTNFDPVPANNVVMFNGTKATVTASTSTSLTVTVPSGATTGKIIVTVEGVAVASSLTDFSVVPVISDFTPSGGYGGVTVVTITGTEWDPTQANDVVKFNGQTASITSVTNSTITATVPAGTATGPITVTVNGQPTTSSSDFNILVPTIASVSPLNGPKNTTVTITGTNFDLTPSHNQVIFNGKVATVVSATRTQLTVLVPQGAGTGQVTLSVDGTPANSNGEVFQFNYELTYTASTFAGGSGMGYVEGTGTGAQFMSLGGIAVDNQGMIYVADFSRIRKNYARWSNLIIRWRWI
ncbi:MAG: IPT/TIG domain-containing protein [Cyclobacteriaceae bacterium]